MGVEQGDKATWRQVVRAWMKKSESGDGASSSTAPVESTTDGDQNEGRRFPFVGIPRINLGGQNRPDKTE